MAKLSYEFVKNEISKRGATLLSSEYINNITPMKIKCSCGNVFERSFSNIRKGKYGNLCDSCYKSAFEEKTKIPYSEIKKRIEAKGHELITKEDEYISTQHKLNIRCECGNEYKKLMSDFNKGVMCKICSGVKKSMSMRRSYSDAKLYTESIGYTLLTSESDYDFEWRNVLIMCDKGHICRVSSQNFFIDRSRCPICFEERRGKGSIVPYDERCILLEKYGYSMITKREDYINSYQIVDVMCDKGHVYKTNMHGFVVGYRCKVCNTSKGEREIELILINLGIEFICQHRFDGCRSKRRLKFDFYLPKYNTCIEYDGRQHFEPVESFGGEREYKELKKRDAMKDKFCNENNIKMIRIPYWDFDNIERILVDKLL